jgi:metallophosphoesterase (TIGR00282 family)
MKVLFIGDIIGRPGRNCLKAHLYAIIERYEVDFVIANAENAAGGFGITKKAAEELFSFGVHVLTSGNHIWDKKEAMPYLQKEDRILRPFNYPPGTPGIGSLMYPLHRSKVAVLNLQGRVFMPNIDCPFRAADEELQRLSEETDIVIVDFHAEATSEKIAIGYYLDGRASAVIGTHTHVQTADERILPKGTAYITDVGMTGPQDSTIGVKNEQVLDRFLYQLPTRFEVAKGPTIFSAVVVEINEETGRATAIQRLQLAYP